MVEKNGARFKEYITEIKPILFYSEKWNNKLLILREVSAVWYQSL